MSIPAPAAAGAASSHPYTLARSPSTDAPRAFFWRWVSACTAGELLGFGAAALWAYLAFRLFGMDAASMGARAGALGLMVLAGTFEGLVLGALQWLVLRRAFPGLRASHWIGATVAVAALGWFLGMLPSTLIGPETASASAVWEPPMGLVLAGAVVLGAAIGAVFGVAQWLVLRQHARGARQWIWANALGWAAGLPWSFVAGSLGDFTRSVLLAVVVSAGAGLLMGLSVAVVTGLVLLRMQPSKGMRMRDRLVGSAWGRVPSEQAGARD